MSNSSSKILRVEYGWDDRFSSYQYLVFYSSGAVRRYDRFNVPESVSSLLLSGPCVCWRDGEYWIYDILSWGDSYV